MTLPHGELEEGLNDCAVIRTTFETIDVFRNDAELQAVMMVIIRDSQANLIRRWDELRGRFGAEGAADADPRLQEFKDALLSMATRGHPPHQLDSLMKVDVFGSVATADRPDAPNSMFRYEFLPQHPLSEMRTLAPQAFAARVFADLRDTASDEGTYADKGTFDRKVFQKYVAVMFANYATTDPMFYGLGPSPA